MPRTRLVLLIWAIGMIVLLGIWGHSLFRKSVIRHNRLSIERQFTLGLVGGSVEITWARIKGNGPNRTQVFFFELKEGSVPGGVPDYKLGRFFHHHHVVGTLPNRYFRTTLQFPLWVLILLFSLPCLLFYRRYQKRQHLHPEVRAAEGTDP